MWKMNNCVYSELSKRQGKALALLPFKTYYEKIFLICLNMPKTWV